MHIIISKKVNVCALLGLFDSPVPFSVFFLTIKFLKFWTNLVLCLTTVHIFQHILSVKLLHPSISFSHKICLINDHMVWSQIIHHSGGVTHSFQFLMGYRILNS